MAESLQGIGNLWDNLTELHHKDPKKYQQIIEESAKEYAKLKLPPVPHTCVLARDKVSLITNDHIYWYYFIVGQKIKKKSRQKNS